MNIKTFYGASKSTYDYRIERSTSFPIENPDLSEVSDLRATDEEDKKVSTDITATPTEEELTRSSDEEEPRKKVI